MSSQEPTLHAEHEPGRTLRALALALASGRSMSDLDLDLSDPQQREFGPYTLVERIGAGGMGLVYRAHQTSLERDVAIKLLNLHWAESAEALERFTFEAKSAAALNHPNIVQVLEIGQVQGVAFIAMQLVRGETLAARLRRDPPSTAESIRLMLEICDAVGYAHRLHLLHLDLKPANVLIDERGEPLVADFGLARRMNAQGQVEAQEVSGTPGYMAPEQVLVKEFRLSAATDIYALGAILYEMLCGQSPHGRGAAGDVIQRALAGQIPPMGNVPRDLQAIALKCLALRAADRYASVAALADDLRLWTSGLPVSVRVPTRLERLQRWYAREPKFAAALVALLVLAMAGSLVFAQLYRRAEHERAGAEGLARLMMSQTPLDASPAPRLVEGFEVPVIDCTETGIDCGGGLDPYATIDPQLPVEQRRRYVDSLREYVPKIAEWGNPRLSAQVANVLDGVQTGLYRAERAAAARATDTLTGLVFGWLLGADGPWRAGETSEAQFERALAKVDQAWQAQVLAQACSPKGVPCARAFARFQELDPDNAAAWVLGLPDPPNAAGDAQLQRAAAAPRLANGSREFIDAALAFGAGLMPTLPPEQRVTPEAFAAESWGSTGVFGYPHGYCKRSLAERDVPAVEAACRGFFAKIEPGMQPMLLDEIIAAVMANRMARTAQEEAAAWRRLQNARWIYSAWKQLPQASGDEAGWLALMREHGELAALRTFVAAAGLPLDAPAHFVTRRPIAWRRLREAAGP